MSAPRCSTAVRGHVRRAVYPAFRRHEYRALKGSVRAGDPGGVCNGLGLRGMRKFARRNVSRFDEVSNKLKAQELLYPRY